MRCATNGGLDTVGDEVTKALQEQYTGNWIWRSVSALIETKDFKCSPKWMAERLHVTVDEIVTALDGLESLGIIKRTGKGYEKVLKYLYFTDRELDPKAILKDHVLVSTQILGRLNPNNPKLPSFYRTAFNPCDIDLARKFFLQMEELMKDFMVQSAQLPSDRVFAVTLSGVDVSGISSGQGEKL